MQMLLLEDDDMNQKTGTPMMVSSASTSFNSMMHPPFRVCVRGNQKQ